MFFKIYFFKVLAVGFRIMAVQAGIFKKVRKIHGFGFKRLKDPVTRSHSFHLFENEYRVPNVCHFQRGVVRRIRSGKFKLRMPLVKGAVLVASQTFVIRNQTYVCRFPLVFRMTGAAGHFLICILVNHVLRNSPSIIRPIQVVRLEIINGVDAGFFVATTAKRIRNMFPQIMAGVTFLLDICMIGRNFT